MNTTRRRCGLELAQASWSIERAARMIRELTPDNDISALWEMSVWLHNLSEQFCPGIHKAGPVPSYLCAEDTQP